MSVQPIINQTDEILSYIPIDFGGGCSVAKASVMAWLIKQYNIQHSVDIGIYRGRSFFPQALAHKNYSRGTVHGVDPYKKEEAIEFDNKAIAKEIKQFVDDTDFDQLYSDVMTFREEHGLTDNSEVVRKTSAQAVAHFRKNNILPGLIHIDGNHDGDAVMDDLKKYYELLPSTGFIVLDDISWSSVKPTSDYARDELGMTLVYCRVDTYNDFSVWAKGVSRLSLFWLRARLAQFSDY